MPDDHSIEIENNYESVPKKFKEEERNYENEKKVNIKIPFRMCVTGASGSGKTNAIVEIIKKINAFDKIMIWAKDTEEPLYASFIDKIQTVEKQQGSSILTVSNDIKDLPSVDTINKENNTLLIIDDMVTEKDKMLNRVVEYFIRGRKKGVSSVFLSQSYFDIPTLIRKQCNYFVFTKISGDRDLQMILKDFRLGVTEEEVKKLYEEATKGGFPNFFMIDCQTNDKALRFRRNFGGLSPPPSTTAKPTATPIGRSHTIRQSKKKSEEDMASINPPATGVGKPRGKNAEEVQKELEKEVKEEQEKNMKKWKEEGQKNNKEWREKSKEGMKKYEEQQAKRLQDRINWENEKARMYELNMEDVLISDEDVEMGSGIKKRKRKYKYSKCSRRKTQRAPKHIDAEIASLISKIL